MERDPMQGASVSERSFVVFPPRNLAGPNHSLSAERKLLLAVAAITWRETAVAVVHNVATHGGRQPTKRVGAPRFPYMAEDQAPVGCKPLLVCVRVTPGRVGDRPQKYNFGNPVDRTRFRLPFMP